MPIETKDVSEVLGIDLTTIDNVADLKKSFEETYTHKKNVDPDVVASITGQMAGKTTTALKKTAKAFGVEIEKAEIEGKKLEEVSELFINRLGEKFGREIEDLKTKGGQGSEERIKELEAQANSFKLKYSEEKEAKDKLSQLLEEEKSNGQKSLLEYKRTERYNDHKSKSMKWASDVDDLKKRGFWSTFEEKYKPEYSDDDKDVIPVDKNGKRIPHPVTTGKFLSFPELMEKEGVENKVWAINPHAGKPAGQPSKPTTATFAATAPNNAGMKLAPRITQR